MSKYVRPVMAALGAAACLSLASVPSHASLIFTPTTFNGNQAVIDQTSGLGWVTPNIATGATYNDIAAACTPSCTGANAGLTWASSSQVNTFWKDVGIPLNVFGSYSSLLGVDLLSPLINALGPTHSTTDFLGDVTNYLGGITDDTPVLGVPNTSYMFHFFSSAGSLFDDESAFTFGAGNGFAELPATRGWFYYSPTVTVPEPGSVALLGGSLLLLGLVFRRRQQPEA